MGEIPEGSVVITPTQIYDRVNTLTEEVTKMLARDKANEQREADAKAEALRRETETARRTAEDKAEVAALQLRISALERKVYIASGFAAAIGGLLGGWLPGVMGS